MENSAVKGNTTELFCMAYLQSIGGNISIPFGNQRYDLILDYCGKLYKIQIKSAKYYPHTDAITIQLTSGNSKRVKKYTDDEIDYFATYYGNTCYLVRKAEVSTKWFTLRLSPPKNKQELGIHLASEYEAERVLN